MGPGIKAGFFFYLNYEKTKVSFFLHEIYYCLISFVIIRTDVQPNRRLKRGG